MADTITFIQGSATLDLNDGTAYETKAIELTTPAPDALMHMPDYGEDRVVRVEDKDRQAILQMRVLGADWDAVLNNLSELRRWFKEAARAETDGDTDTVYLQLKRGTGSSTASNATNNQIRFGWDEGASSIFTQWGQKDGAEQAKEIFVNLVLTPYGDRATTITLRNDLASSAHFVEDTDADDLADGWTEQLDVDTISLDMTNYLLGGQSQKLVADGVAEDGIFSDTVTNTADTEAVGFVWAYITAGEWVLRLRDVDAPSTLDAVTMDAAGTNADGGFSRVDADGKIWYRYTVSEAAIPGNNDVALYVFINPIGPGTIYLDGAYLELGRTDAPDCFASTPDLENRMDLSVDESNLNYIDVGLIPGDAPAKMLLTNASDDNAPSYQIWSLEQDGKYNSTVIPFVLENTLFALESGTGTWTANDGAGAPDHGGSYGRYDAHAVTETGGRIGYDFTTGAVSNALAGRVFKVIVACQSNSDPPTGTISLAIGTGDGTAKSRTASIFAKDNYELKYVGLFRPSPLIDSEATSTAVTIYLDIAGLGLSETFDIDVVFLMPVDKGAIIAKVRAGDVSLFVDGPRDSAYTNTGFSDYIGKPFDLLPGLIMNRLRVLNYNSDTDDYDMADAFPITLTVTPRTRHLMGAL